MSKRQQYSLMLAAGLKPGPHVSLAHAIDKFKKEKLREIILYCVFLIIFIASSNLQRDVEHAHYYAQTVKAVVLLREFPTNPYAIRFENISSHKHFWDFMIEVVPPMLFQEKWYNGDAFQGVDAGQVLLANRLVQAPRLRQVRVGPKVCSVPPRLDAYMSTCYPKYRSGSKSSEEPIPGWPPGTMMEYRKPQQLNSHWLVDGLYPYEGGGFIVDFPLNSTQDDLREILGHFRDEKWTDIGTRAVFFDFALYNANLRFFLSVRLQWEFSPTGTVTPQHFFRVMRLGLFSPREYIALVLDVIVYAFILYYSMEDSGKMIRLRAAYFDDPWRFFHWIMYIFFLITFVFKVQFLLTSLSYVNTEADRDSEQAVLDFEYLGWVYSQIWNWTGFNTVCVWIRAFSFLKYINESTTQLAATILSSAGQIGRFFCVFLLVLWVYSVSFSIAFGTDLAENRNLLSSAVELMKVFALGSKHFDNITEINSLLGPILFLTFQVGCGFIFFGIPGAILNKMYRSISNSGVDDPVAKEFRKVIHKAISRFKKAVYYMGKKDEAQRFREEREKEFENIFSVAERHEEQDAQAASNALIAQMKADLGAVSKHMVAVKEKIDTFSHQQDKLYAKEPKSTVVKANLIIGRRVAWSANAKGEMTEELEGCVAVQGNKAVIPPNWKKYLKDDGTVFYHNRDTGKTQWDPPVIYRAAVQPDADADDSVQEPPATSPGATEAAGVFADGK